MHSIPGMGAELWKYSSRLLHEEEAMRSLILSKTAEMVYNTAVKIAKMRKYSDMKIAEM